jgi:hypothetical protein
MTVKSETFVVLKKFKSLVENLKDFNINTSCLNQVGKYTKEFVEFFQQQNITKGLTIVNTFRQHVVKEHKNKTILGKVIEHVIEQQCSILLWMEVVNTTTYLMNISPSKFMG